MINGHLEWTITNLNDEETYETTIFWLIRKNDPQLLFGLRRDSSAHTADGATTQTRTGLRRGVDFESLSDMAAEEA